VEGRAIAASFAAIDEESIARRIERAQKKSAELAQEARHSGEGGPKVSARDFLFGWIAVPYRCS
jgi:hypothetical protein